MGLDSLDAIKLPHSVSLVQEHPSETLVSESLVSQSQSITLSVSHTVSQSVTQSASQTVNHAVSQSVNHPVSHPKLSVCLFCLSVSVHCLIGQYKVGLHQFVRASYVMRHTVNFLAFLNMQNGFKLVYVLKTGLLHDHESESQDLNCHEMS